MLEGEGVGGGGGVEGGVGGGGGREFALGGKYTSNYTT